MKVFLVGKPRIVDSRGTLRPVPGHQPWAVLARLLRAQRPMNRRELAEELFPDTEDPLGALRWCLASLRRATGADTLQGDPIDLNFPTGTYVDIWNLDLEDLDLQGKAEFLAGVEPAASIEFNTWLMIEREHIASRLFERMRRDSIQALATGNQERALNLARHAIRIRPLDESGHIILVKCLAMSGRIDAAVAHVAATEAEFRKELGEPPSDALRAAARRSIAEAPEGVSRSAVVESLVKSGSAAISAGAVDAGLDCLRRAAADSDKLGDEYLQAKALVELGTALVHSVRGFDDEGAIILRQGFEIASGKGCAEIAATALSELGYIEALAGRRPTAAGYLADALSYANEAPRGRARAHAFLGFNLVDWGKLEPGLTHFEQSLEIAQSTGDRRQEIWTLGIGAWGMLRAGRNELARDWLTNCLALCDETNWLAFRPWPVALLEEARLALGESRNSAVRVLEEALALSNQLADPCWQAVTARSLSLVHARAEDEEKASTWMEHARRNCCAVTDLYAGLLVEIVAGQIVLFRKSGHHQKAAEAGRELLSLAARTHADSYLDFAASAMNPARIESVGYSVRRPRPRAEGRASDPAVREFDR